jgi:hypothetical protein
MKLVVLVFAGALVLSPSALSAQTCGAAHLVTVEPNGSVVAGSKDALRRAMSAGTPIRVGWGLDANNDNIPDVSHWADAGFLTDFEGEIFAQLADIQRQQPMRNPARVTMPAGRQRWTGLLGTNGRLESHFDDGSAPSVANVRSTWCVDPRAVSCAPEWRLVYRHDADGKPLDGSKDALLTAVRSGAPLRFAWGFAAASAGQPVSVEHVAEPVFVSVMRGEHVFVQLPEHIAQVSYLDPAKARFDQAAVMWRGLMGTDGTFDAVMVDRATGKEVRRLPQRAGLAWFAQMAPASCQSQPPLELAVPGGTRPDASRPKG